MSVATLPSNTNRVVDPQARSSAAACRISGEVNRGFRASTGTAAQPSSRSRVTLSSRKRSPSPGLITRQPDSSADSSGGGRPKARAYVAFPRKYRPLTKLKTSPSGAPSASRSCRASGNAAAGFRTSCARSPPRFAGESKKMVEGDAGPLILRT